MTAPDPMKLAEDLTAWAQGLQRRAQSYNTLQQQLDSTSVTAQSPDGAVRVTVDANGVPTELTITERGRGADPAALSQALMATLRRAHAQLRDRVSDLTASTVGDDAAASEIVAQYRERFPDPAPESAPEPTLNVGRIDEETPVRREPRPTRRRPTRDRGDDDGDDIFGGPVLRR